MSTDLKAPQQAALDAIFKDCGQPDAPGLVVGVAYQGETIYRRAFGAANIEHGVANTPETVMRLASVTKQMTCLAVLLLAEDGKLAVDDSVRVLIPELPVLAGEPSLRQLMQHQGGYHDCLELFYLGSGFAQQGATASLDTMLRQTAASFAPGEKQLYCNGGYTLLSTLIERASGLSFEAFMRQRLFEPLGMLHSYSVPDDYQVVPGLATLYMPTATGAWRRIATPLEGNRGEGAAVTTVDDMLRWMQLLRADMRPVGSAQSWQQLQTTGQLTNGLPSTYTLGLNRHFYRGVEVLQHGGSLMGASSQMVTVPAHGLDIIIMANGALINPVQMAWQIVDALLGDQLSGSAAPLAASEGLGHLFGRSYVGASGLLLGFGDAGGMLGTSIFNSPAYPFLRDRGETLSLLFEEGALGPWEIRKADLQASADGSAPSTLPFSDGGTVETLHLLPATPPSNTEAGADVVGRYAVADFDAEATIWLEGEQLRLRIAGPRGWREAALKALSHGVFGLTMLDPQAPSFASLTVQRAGGAVQGLWLSGGRSRGMWFQRLSA